MAQQGQAQPQQAPAQQAAQVVAPVITTDKLRGSPLDTFKGNRRHSELFLHQFNLYWGLNETHEVMLVPYFHVMYALSLMRGPNIDDWVNDQDSQSESQPQEHKTHSIETIHKYGTISILHSPMHIQILPRNKLLTRN